MERSRFAWGTRAHRLLASGTTSTPGHHGDTASKRLPPVRAAVRRRRAAAMKLITLALIAATAGTAAAQAAVPQARATISGIVFDSLVRRGPLAGAEVVMVESGRSTVTNANGRFRFDSVVAGTVRLTFYHDGLDSLGVGVAPVVVTVSDSGSVRVTLTTPAVSTVLRALCRGASDGAGMVVGRVRDVDDRSPLRDAEVTASWSE